MREDIINKLLLLLL